MLSRLTLVATLFDDPEITWLDIEDFEERFEAHDDALIVGEELALNVCKTQAAVSNIIWSIGRVREQYYRRGNFRRSFYS